MPTWLATDSADNVIMGTSLTRAQPKDAFVSEEASQSESEALEAFLGDEEDLVPVHGFLRRQTDGPTRLWRDACAPSLRLQDLPPVLAPLVAAVRFPRDLAGADHLDLLELGADALWGVDDEVPPATSSVDQVRAERRLRDEARRHLRDVVSAAGLAPDSDLPPLRTVYELDLSPPALVALQRAEDCFEALANLVVERIGRELVEGEPVGNPDREAIRTSYLAARHWVASRFDEHFDHTCASYVSRSAPGGRVRRPRRAGPHDEQLAALEGSVLHRARALQIDPAHALGWWAEQG